MINSRIIIIRTHTIREDDYKFQHKSRNTTRGVLNEEREQRILAHIERVQNDNSNN